MRAGSSRNLEGRAHNEAHWLQCWRQKDGLEIDPSLSFYNAYSFVRGYRYTGTYQAEV